MPSPICLVNNESTTNGVDLNAADYITISLANKTGVNSWKLTCIGASEGVNPVSITEDLTYRKYSNTYTMFMPRSPSALIFQSTINNGIDNSGNFQNTYTTTFGAFIKNEDGYRLIAVNQTFEGDSEFGWIKDINSIIAVGINKTGDLDLDSLNTTGDISAASINTNIIAPLNSITVPINIVTDTNLDGYISTSDCAVVYTGATNKLVHLPEPTLGRILFIAGTDINYTKYLVPYASELIRMQSGNYPVPNRERNVTLVSDGINWFFAHRQQAEY
jgi:hypothetical protein